MSGETSVRNPAVAGLFYPHDPNELRTAVSDHFRRAGGVETGDRPKALIVPHAGYIYSGDVAAAAYAQVAAHRRTIRRVVLFGPSHRVYLRGAATPRADAFATPLGSIRIDAEQRERLLGCAHVIESDRAHALEHSLEVQLPFLQVLLGESFTLLPVVFGAASADEAAALFEAVWGEEDTLILASSDLSHYHPYDAAQRIDAATSDAILRFEANLSGDQACGAVAINGLLKAASRRKLAVAEIARCNSGDTAGDRTRVVGYGAFGFYARA